MKKVIIIIALIFSFIAFTYNLPSNNNYDILSAFIFNGINFVFSYFFLFFAGFIVLLIFAIRSFGFEKNHPKHKMLFSGLFQSALMVIVGTSLSFFILLIMGIIEFNFLAYTIDMSPGLLGIQTNVKTEVNTLKSASFAPVIIASDNNHFKELQAIAQATTGTDSFYGKFILPSIPEILVLPTKTIGSTILIDNTLIISQVNPDDLQALSPVVGYLFVKSYFPQRSIRHYPNFQILSEQQYEEFRKLDYAKKIANVKNEITVAKDQIASLSAGIQKDKNDISFNQNLIQTTYTKRDKQYSDCISAGHYQGSIFVHTNTKQSCQYIITNSEKTVAAASDTIDSLNYDLKQKQDLLSAYNYYENLFNTQITIANSLQANIPHELGFFEPPDSLKIVIESDNPHQIADYFETVVHEYYHYASYIKDKSFASTFFEEGFTEYFARQTIQNSLDVSTNLGYPVFVKIIKQMTNVIPETDLASIYFNKDQPGLEKVLDNAYGDGFYQQNALLFETLTVTSDPKQVLQLANTIMKKIGGTPLTQKDLLSTQSSL